MPVVYSRQRRIKAAPDRIWGYVADVAQWPKWFTEAERGEILSGIGVGRKQRMYGHARGRETEIDSTITEYQPGRLLRWHHDAERVDGEPGSVVFAKDATAEVQIAPDGDGSLVTYKLTAEPGSVFNWLMIGVLARGPIGKSFDTSLARLAALVE